MSEDIWAIINKEGDDYYFEFGRVGSSETILQTNLTPAQLLQIFQHSGIDFHEYSNTTYK